MEKGGQHSEQALLQLVAAGDISAYRQLFDAYWDRVYYTGLRLTKTPEQARDLAQDIFLKVWDNRAKLIEVRDFSAWLFTVARNLIHDQVRTRVFRESNRAFLEEYFNEDASSPQEILERKESGASLDAAIDKLPSRLREVINLRRREGLSHKEIAERLHITPLSSKTYLVRALMALRVEMLKNPGKGLMITVLLLSLLFF